MRDLPVCVLMCLFNKLGRSNALPQTSHGSRARSPRDGRDFGDERLDGIVQSNISGLLPEIDDVVEDSPETDLRSSSVPDGGDIGNITRESSDIDRSSGESRIKKNK